MLEEASGELPKKSVQIYEWRKCFHDGQASVNDYLHCW
jgi:hypothetical protein